MKGSFESKCQDPGNPGYCFFKLRLGALIPRSVGLSVCWSVLQKLQKITKLYKCVQNIKKR